jgi:maleylacetate reductase
MTDSPTGPRDHFEIAPLPTRTVFGPGSRHRLGEVLDQVGIDRVFVVCTPRGRDEVADVLAALGERVVGVFDQARMHVPRPTVDAAREALGPLRPDGCLAIGGGSSIGLAKALALEAGLPYVAVPTTYAGSEMTSIWGMTTDGVKTTGRDERVRPMTVVCDPELSATLPLGTSTVSGLNAIAHAAEALYAPDGSPVIDLLAVEAVEAVAGSLEVLQDRPEDPDARAQVLYGATLCGVCLGATAMSLHHKICHVLGGSFDLPHAETHATVLPYVLAFNLPVAPRAEAKLRAALAGREPAGALWELGRPADVPRSLAALGFSAEDVPRVATLVLKALGDPQANPRPVSLEELETLLRAALDGGAPTSPA